MSNDPGQEQRKLETRRTADNSFESFITPNTDTTHIGDSYVIESMKFVKADNFDETEVGLTEVLDVIQKKIDLAAVPDAEHYYDEDYAFEIVFKNCEFIYHALCFMMDAPRIKIVFDNCVFEESLRFIRCRVWSVNIVQSAVRGSIVLEECRIISHIDFSFISVGEVTRLTSLRQEVNEQLELASDSHPNYPYISINGIESHNGSAEPDISEGGEKADYKGSLLVLSDIVFDNARIGEVNAPHHGILVRSCKFKEFDSFYEIGVAKLSLIDLEVTRRVVVRNFTPPRDFECIETHFNEGMLWLKGNLVGREIKGLSGPGIAFRSDGVDVTTDKKRRFPTGWNSVRSFGNLAILTRTSYLALLLVPILAGMWPTVRMFANQWDIIAGQTERGVAEISEKLAAIAEQQDRLGKAIKKGEASGEIMGDGLLSGVQELSEKTDSLRRDFVRSIKEPVQELRSNSNLGSPHLPYSLALSWAAALCVTIGHMLYEGLAPLRIRKESEDEFARSRLADFSEQSSDARDHVLRAIDSIRQCSILFPEKIHRNFTLRHGVLVYVPSAANSIIPTKNNGRVYDEALPRIVIDEGARAEYILESQKMRLWAILSLILYAIAMASLFLVIALQSIAVVRATLGI